MLGFGNFWLTGGYDGLTLKNPTIFGINLRSDHLPRSLRHNVVDLCCRLLSHGGQPCVVGRAGRRMLAVRSNERAATAVGVSVRGAKLAAFAIAAAIAAVGGVLLTFAQPVALFASYSPFDSIEAVSYAVVGGLGFATGALSGSVLAPGGCRNRSVLSRFWDPVRRLVGFRRRPAHNRDRDPLFQRHVAAFNVDVARRVAAKR